MFLHDENQKIERTISLLQHEQWCKSHDDGGRLLIVFTCVEIYDYDYMAM